MEQNRNEVNVEAIREKLNNAPTYIGTKVIKASFMYRGDFYNSVYGSLIDGGNAEDEGFAVMYDGGYISWSPADTFQKAYRQIRTCMTFGMAIEALKTGKKIARKGWNGKGMWIQYIAGDTDDGTTGDYTTTVSAWNGKRLPFLAMKTADDAFVPWLASQTDMLADDWVIVKQTN